jgi:hypothetical protein
MSVRRSPRIRSNLPFQIAARRLAQLNRTVYVAGDT